MIETYTFSFQLTMSDNFEVRLEKMREELRKCESNVVTRCLSFPIHDTLLVYSAGSGNERGVPAAGGRYGNVL